MRILFLAPRLPVPADTGGKIRTFNLIKQIAKKHKTDLVCFSFEKDDDRHAKELEALGIRVTLVPIQEPGLTKTILSILFDPVPFTITKYRVKVMQETIEQLVRDNSYDLVHADHIHMSNYREYFNSRPCVVDEHNVEYKILERCAHVEKSLIKRMIFKDQSRKMEEFERNSIRNMATFLSVSEDDKNLLNKIVGNGQPGHVIPNGVDTQYFKRQSTKKIVQEEAIVFTGSMDWLPNDDSAIYFCNDILPLLWKVKPNVKFYIVGKGPSEALKKIAKSEKRIVLTGRVDDVRAYVEKSKIFVVPLRIGGGTRLKILEAMSMEKAIVSTSIGAEGIDYTEDVDIVLANKPEIFSQKIVSLLENDEKCKLLGSAGRKLVMAKYDWNIIGKKLVNIYEEFKVKK